jgi:EAL and modified HD-GYP domain-containing signal transduction protein
MVAMTRPSDGDALAPLGAAVDAAIPADLARTWMEHLSRQPTLLARQGIFSASGHAFAYQVSVLHPARPGVGVSWTTEADEQDAAHVLAAAFGREDLADVAHGRLVFVSCPRAYLVGDLPLPDRTDRLVVELPTDLPTDAETLAGIAQLRGRGFRIALPSFSDRPAQRRLLPLADFVKVDVRDLDVEGHPVVRVARSCGATLVGEYLEHPRALSCARDMGISLFQGNLLERIEIVDRAPVEQAGR